MLSDYLAVLLFIVAALGYGIGRTLSWNARQDAEATAYANGYRDGQQEVYRGTR